MPRFFLLLTLLPLGLAGCGHLGKHFGCETDCTVTTPCPAPSSAAPVSVACPAPRIEVQAPPAVQVTCPAPQVQFVTAPLPQPAAPAFTPAPLMQPYAYPQQQTAFVLPRPRASLALMLDWFDISLPLPRLAAIPTPPETVQVAGPQYMPPIMTQPLMQPVYGPMTPLMQPQYVPAPPAQAYPQAMILSVATPPPPAPVVAQPQAVAQPDLCKQLEALKMAIEANQKAAGCGK